MRDYHTSFKPLPTRERDIVSDGDAVLGYSILTTDTVVFVALENDRGHTTTRTVEHEGRYHRLGSTTSRPLPASLASLPYDEYRVTVVTSWQDASVESAREMIREAYPATDQLVNSGLARWSGGDLLTTLDCTRKLGAVPTVPVQPKGVGNTTGYGGHLMEGGF